MDMDYKEIQNLIKLAGSSNISEIKLKDGDFELLIRTTDYYKLSHARSSQPAVYNIPAHTIPQSTDQQVSAADIQPKTEALLTEQKPAEAQAAATDLLEIRSPIVGTFFRSSSPDKDPYIKIGDFVAPKSVVCIVEAMKLFNEIESEISGKIVDILVENGSPVEYDQVLFLVDPKG